ncbi:MAG TPA: hypothetical protein VJ938_11210, partial [Acidimicrobiia bacterium]|nr:hypothetical protein [Acidimicrobiia bacterium]
LRVLGRADEVIVTGGENVNPGRVEAVLASHPGVERAVVVCVPDHEWGEVVAALYVGDVGIDTLREWAREHLASHELPRVIRQVTSIPLAGLGKPDLGAVRHLLSNSPPRSVCPPRSGGRSLPPERSGGGR